MIFVSHDLPAVADISERIAVLDRGEIIEDAPAGRVLRSPAHPRTGLLVESCLTLDGVPDAFCTENRAKEPRPPEALH